MTHRGRLVALSANTLILASLVAGCGDYSQPKDTATGGTSGTAPTGGSSGTAQTGGTSGTAQGGSGGTSGTGQGGGGASGTSGQAGGGAAGAGGASGGGAGQGSCTDVAPCGGELVGAWTVSSCPLMVTDAVDVTGLGLVADCMAPVMGSMTITGTLNFVAGGTYTDATTTSSTSTFELGPQCLEISGTETTCEEIARPISSVGFTMVTCTPNPTTMGCTCTGTVANQMGGFGFVSYDAATTGTFMAMNNEVSLSSFSMPAEYSYCVQGNTLTMTLERVARTGTMSSPIVLTKQ